MINTELYDLHEQIARLINESNLPSVAVLFVIKDVLHDIEQSSIKSMEIERGANENEQSIQ